VTRATRSGVCASSGLRHDEIGRHCKSQLTAPPCERVMLTEMVLSAPAKMSPTPASMLRRR